LVFKDFLIRFALFLINSVKSLIIKIISTNFIKAKFIELHISFEKHIFQRSINLSELVLPAKRFLKKAALIKLVLKIVQEI